MITSEAKGRFGRVGTSGNPRYTDLRSQRRSTNKTKTKHNGQVAKGENRAASKGEREKKRHIKDRKSVQRGWRGRTKRGNWKKKKESKRGEKMHKRERLEERKTTKIGAPLCVVRQSYEE